MIPPQATVLGISGPISWGNLMGLLGSGALRPVHEGLLDHWCVSRGDLWEMDELIRKVEPFGRLYFEFTVEGVGIGFVVPSMVVHFLATFPDWRPTSFIRYLNSRGALWQ